MALVADLADRTGRVRAARALAAEVGAEDLVVFVTDPEVNTPLPALGFPQTLPDGRRWRDFVRRCSGGKGVVEGLLPYPDAQTVRAARGFCCGEAVLVLLGGRPRPEF